MFCMNCGNQLPDGAKFCGKCGTAIAVSPNNPVVTSPPITKSSSGSKRLNILSVALIAVMIILLSILAFGIYKRNHQPQNRGYEETVQLAAEAIIAGDTDILKSITHPEHIAWYVDHWFNGSEDNYWENLSTNHMEIFKNYREGYEKSDCHVSVDEYVHEIWGTALAEDDYITAYLTQTFFTPYGTFEAPMVIYLVQYDDVWYFESVYYN